MSRRRRAENPVSLFPFVAVMASTMGALILLLLVTARQASKARDAAWLETQRSTAPLPKLPPLPGKMEFPELPPLPPHELPPIVDRVLPEMPPLTDPRAAILARREQIEREIAELRKKRERTPKAGEERLAPLMREAALLRSRLERILDDRRKAQAKLKDAKSDADELAAEKERAERRRQSPNKYAVTPYFGPNATNRRPIYLECTKDAIILRPEGVAVPISTLDGDARADNPLARLVHAVADYWMKREPDPSYPLLIVRPDGVRSYYTARSALEFLRYPFGYELVAAERELAYPAVDETVRKLAAAALVEASQPRRFAGGSNRPGFGNGGGNGDGDGNDDGPPGDTRELSGGSGRGRFPGNSNSQSTTQAIPTSVNPNGVVAAVVPPEPEQPVEQPAEIGASVRDFISRRAGPTGTKRGLGSLAAMAPTPFESEESRGMANARSTARMNRDRTQANVDAEIERPRPTLSQRLQEMAQDAPIPLPNSKPQTQQWQPGLDGLDRTPNNRSDAEPSTPNGAWSASPGVRRSPDTQDEKTSAPRRETSSVGEQLWNAANSGKSTAGEADPFAVGPSRMEFIERVVRCEVRTASIVTADGETVSLQTDDEATNAARIVVKSCFAAVDQWGQAPAGRSWRPFVLLLVRNGAAENAFRIRAVLAARGVAVKQLWVDDHGVPSLVPAWGR